MFEKIPPEKIWQRPDPDFDFDNKDRKFTPTTTKPLCLLEKYQALSSHPSSRGLISAAYRDAIEVSGSRIHGAGLPTLAALIPVAGLAFFWWLALKRIDAVMLTVAIIQTLVFGNVALFLVMLEFMPRSYVLLNRKDRTVSFQRVRYPRLFGAWRKVQRPFLTYSWDEAKARIYRESEVVGGQLSRTSHSLWLVWGKDPDSPRTYKDSVRLGDNDPFERAPIHLWEHVRRFMEEDGPHFSRGDAALGGATRTRVTPPFPDAILAAAGPALTPAQIAAFAG